MKLLITTLTMIFINFGAFGALLLEYQKVDAKLCYEALSKGKVLYYSDKGYYTVSYGYIYNFFAGFRGNHYEVSYCVRTEKP